VWSEKLPFAGYSVVKELLNFGLLISDCGFESAINIPQSALHVSSSGEYRARTGDLLVANQALSQLS
jgi:hypothetical protein